MKLFVDFAKKFMKFELDDLPVGLSIVLIVGCLYSLFVSFRVTYLCLTPFHN